MSLITLGLGNTSLEPIILLPPAEPDGQEFGVNTTVAEPNSGELTVLPQSKETSPPSDGEFK